MDERSEVILTRLLYTALAVIGGMLVVANLAYPWAILLLVGLLALSFTIRNAILIGSYNRNAALIPSLFVDLILIVVISQVDSSSISILLSYLLVADAALLLSIRLSAFMGVILFIVQCVLTVMRSGEASVLSLFPNALVSLAVIITLYFSIHAVRYQTRQKQQLAVTMTELKLKSMQLEHAFLKLRETTEDLEDMTILKERNRIAREIHDTVGHTLTTVLLEMEAGERLIAKDPQLAQEKLKLAKEQVRKGLQDIRQSVHMLNTGRDMLSFKQSLQLLLDDTTRSGTVFIHSQISELPQLTEIQEKTLYRAVQEGLTNGIRHGGSTAFVFHLTYENGSIQLNLSDNGKGNDKIEQGFGLTAMEERVKVLGGTFSTTSRSGEGFAITITIPVEKGAEDDGTD